MKLSDTNDYPDTSMENMQAMEIGGRDVLAIGLQDCETTRRRALAEAALSSMT